MSKERIETTLDKIIIGRGFEYNGRLYVKMSSKPDDPNSDGFNCWNLSGDGGYPIKPVALNPNSKPLNLNMDEIVFAIRENIFTR